jgi:hypothetical protein
VVSFYQSILSNTPRPSFRWKFAEDASIRVNTESKQGWTAYFVEMTFPSGGAYSYKFTTGVRVAPDRLPFGPPHENDVVRGDE